MTSQKPVKNIKKQPKGILFLYLLPFLWMMAIFFLSHLPGSETANPNTYWEIFTRKVAHFLEFGGLAFWWWIFWSKINKKKISWEDSFSWSLVATVLYALIDEVHQNFVAGRSGRVEDFLVDTAAAWLVLQILSWRKISLSLKLKIILLFLNLIFLSGAFFLLLREGNTQAEVKEYYHQKWLKENYNNTEEKTEEKNENNDTEKKEDKKDGESTEEIVIKKIIPNKFLIEGVSFTTQAPLANWDEYHEEACEEASVIMLEYFKKNKPLDQEIAEREIQKMISFQIENYGDYRDSDAKGIARLAKDFFGLNLKIVYDFSLEELKEYLNQGNPIIVPTAGRELKNPYFTPPGPLYHNLVLVGYENGKIIANDPGTKRGENYTYDENILYSAIHDFPGEKEAILEGRKALLILE